MTKPEINQINTEEVLDKYRAAGKIHQQVMEEARDKIKIGMNIYEYARFIDERILELADGSAFPVNISFNDAAAHDSPLLNDTRVFGEDVVKVDVGVHVDGYIADGAMTIDLSGKHGDLVKASEEGLKAALDTVKAGVTTQQIGAAVEDTITGLGFNPIRNLMGHGLAQYTAHAEPSVPNVRHSGFGAELRAGDTIAIEPFATDGEGFIDNGHIKEIYSQVKLKQTRMPFVRKVLEQINTYNGLPFAKRWLSGDKLDLALIQLEREGIITGYPILMEVSGGLVSQAEHTVIVTEDGCEVTTRG
ncbi:Methionine aminopeptidase 1, mitochondrial [Methanimicrococcus sp. At1]|uniref:Methionine aminopeptidase n=1 Tax=Methanimicrococcus hacksteinii TaxID=3028293 RepID=A0ABU3VN60_9EURY|nr:type II methionyl aminopeptidase [Methanimicrococcus sp. At1]MDV0444833.1 Methionine aminopeptidase 1, mitochondrial [Methanimicrococcus sp. At1]